MPNTVIALDVGGTKISAALVTSAGSAGKAAKILKRTKIPTESDKGKKVVLANIVRAIEEVMPDKGEFYRARGGTLSFSAPKAIGVGIAGLTDHRKGVYLQGPNLPKDLQNVPLAAILRKQFKKPVSLDNDVHCFTLGEAKFGKGKRFSSVFGLTLGTGIGGGIVINGQIYRGRNNAAGEIGHTVLSLSSDIHCSCGKTGHFEAFGSGTAMSNLYPQKKAAFTAPAAGQSPFPRLSPLDVENLYKSGDKNAQTVLKTMTDAISAGLANVIHVLNPDIIVVGGGLARVDILWNPVEKAVKNHLFFPQLAGTPIERSKLGGDANLLGAALITQKL